MPDMQDLLLAVAERQKIMNSIQDLCKAAVMMEAESGRGALAKTILDILDDPNPLGATQRTTTLYISHGADENPDWFIVEPRDSPEGQVASLLKAKRTVYEFTAWPFTGNQRKLET